MNVMLKEILLIISKMWLGVQVEHHVEDLWKSLKDDLFSAADKNCGWTKEPSKRKITWWWNEDMDQAIKAKRQLWKD